MGDSAFLNPFCVVTYIGFKAVSRPIPQRDAIFSALTWRVLLDVLFKAIFMLERCESLKLPEMPCKGSTLSILGKTALRHILLPLESVKNEGPMVYRL